MRKSIRQSVPEIFSRLTEKQLQALPEHADIGDVRAVRTMLGAWAGRGKPRATWDATALHLAVYRGDPEMTDLY